MREHYSPKTGAIIGSFRKNYVQVLEDWHIFTGAGLQVTSPKGTPVIRPDEEFVRFESDDPELSDADIQRIALHRILRADFVYAVLPEGYLGNTTSYEIGQVLARNRPLYCGEHPLDLPIEIPADNIASARELVDRFQVSAPQPVLSSLVGESERLEYNLLTGNFLEI